MLFNLIKYGAGLGMLWIEVIFLITHAIFYKLKTTQIDPTKHKITNSKLVIFLIKSKNSYIYKYFNI